MAIACTQKAAKCCMFQAVITASQILTESRECGGIVSSVNDM